MRTLIAVLVVALIAVVTIRLYLARAQTGGPNSTPVQAIADAGVKNDLLQIAQAERAYWVEHGMYASLDELVSSGAVSAAKRGREDYTYSIETRADGFTVLARCQKPNGQPCAGYSVDQTMEVHRAP
jgi:competence protein ComGC